MIRWGWDPHDGCEHVRRRKRAAAPATSYRCFQKKFHNMAEMLDGVSPMYFVKFFFRLYRIETKKIMNETKLRKWDLIFYLFVTKMFAQTRIMSEFRANVYIF